jgi:predicted transporter
MIERNSDSKTKIAAGIFMLILVIIYCSDRIINHLNLRLFDWLCWTVMVITGTILITQGIQFDKK